MTGSPKIVFSFAGAVMLALLHVGPAAAQTTVNICDRTAVVEAAILATARVTTSDCAMVDAQQLAMVNTLGMRGMGITSLQVGDFAGMTGLRSLGLAENDLGALPAGLFDGLDSLRSLFLRNNPNLVLPAGIFDDVLDTLTQTPLDGTNYARGAAAAGIGIMAPSSAAMGAAATFTVIASRDNSATPVLLADVAVDYTVSGPGSVDATGITDTDTATAGIQNTLRIAAGETSGTITVTPGAAGELAVMLTGRRVLDGAGNAILTDDPVGLTLVKGNFRAMQARAVVTITATNPDAQDVDREQDSDGDGLSDAREAIFGTDPADPDTDDDGTLDGGDAFPLDPSEQVDTDGDLVGDNEDTDDDNDGVPDDDDAFPLDPSEQSDRDADGIGDNVDAPFSVARQHLQLASGSASVASLHIVNTWYEPQDFTGTLYDAGGNVLGQASRPLGSVMANARLILDSGDLERIFGVAPWSGPAMLAVTGSARFNVISSLTSPGGLVSDANCAHENRALHIEGFDSYIISYVRFINTGDTLLRNLRGTLYGPDGEIIGAARSILIDTLAPGQQISLFRDNLANRVGDTWIGEAMLEMSRVEGLRLLNFSAIDEPLEGGGGELFFTCYEEELNPREYLQTVLTGDSATLIHIINTSPYSLRQRFTGTLYNSAGEQLGAANRFLHERTIRARGRVVLSADDLERIFNIPPWEGPAMLDVQGSETGYALLSRRISPSGLVSDASCVRRDQVHNLLGSDAAAATSVRFINTGEDALGNIRGTLYGPDGAVIGRAGATLLGRLAPKAQVSLDRDDLVERAGDSWSGTASLRIEPAPAALRLLNLNQVNNEVYFNFSCHDAAR